MTALALQDIEKKRQTDGQSDVLISPFNEKFVPSICDIMAQICIAEYKCDQWGNSAFMQNWKDWIYSQTYDFYRFYPNFMQMAIHNGKLVGFMSLKKLNESTAEIKKLFVLSNYRNQGVGSRLYDALMSHLDELGHITNLQITICAPFYEAINFYADRGFKITFMDIKKFEYRLERPVL